MIKYNFILTVTIIVLYFIWVIVNGIYLDSLYNSEIQIITGNIADFIVRLEKMILVAILSTNIYLYIKER